MTKYVSMTKLISLLPEFNLNELYDELKDDYSSTSFYNDGKRIFEYPYRDNESNNNYIQYLYDEETKKVYIRYITNMTTYQQRDSLRAYPYTKWLVAIQSPEIDWAHMIDSRYTTTEKLANYINLINYVLRKLEAKTSTLKSILDDSSIELDDPNDIFNVQSLDIEWNKRIGNYLYLNGLDNGALLSRIPYIIEHIGESDTKQLHLLNYTASLVTRLSFTELTELTKLLTNANRHIQNASTYSISINLKTNFNEHLTNVINRIQERRNELMTTQVQMVPLSVWKKDATLRENIEQGANVRVILPMSLATN